MGTREFPYSQILLNSRISFSEYSHLVCRRRHSDSGVETRERRRGERGDQRSRVCTWEKM